MSGAICIARGSASFDAVPVFLSARAQLGSASQLLRLTAAGPLVADVADIEMSRRPYGWSNRSRERALAKVALDGIFATDTA